MLKINTAEKTDLKTIIGFINAPLKSVFTEDIYQKNTSSLFELYAINAANIKNVCF